MEVAGSLSIPFSSRVSVAALVGSRVKSFQRHFKELEAEASFTVDNINFPSLPRSDASFVKPQDTCHNLIDSQCRRG